MKKMLWWSILAQWVFKKFIAHLCCYFIHTETYYLCNAFWTFFVVWSEENFTPGTVFLQIYLNSFLYFVEKQRAKLPGRARRRPAWLPDSPGNLPDAPPGPTPGPTPGQTPGLTPGPARGSKQKRLRTIFWGYHRDSPVRRVQLVRVHAVVEKLLAQSKPQVKEVYMYAGLGYILIGGQLCTSL